MTQLIVMIGTVSLIAAILGALIALKLQYNYLNKMQAQFQAWERAQESHQRNWEIQQEKNAAELERRITRQVEQIHEDWEEWKVWDRERIETLVKQYEESELQLHVKRELDRLPRVEDAPLILDAKHQHQHIITGWQPPMLKGADLSGHDFSHRFLGQADLRNAQLIRANFYMADLSGACLIGANLSDAYLVGANLSGADLRDATLTDTDLLVADLHGTVLIGVNLLRARNLTAQQRNTAIYDASTQFGGGTDFTPPRVQSVQPIVSSSFSAPEIAEALFVSPTDNTSLANNPSPTTSADETQVEKAVPTSALDLKSQIKAQTEADLSSPPQTGDNLPGLEGADLLINTQENRHIEELDITTPSPEYNGTGRAKAS
jgi:hypothetical protein